MNRNTKQRLTAQNSKQTKQMTRLWFSLALIFIGYLPPPHSQSQWRVHEKCQLMELKSYESYRVKILRD